MSAGVRRLLDGLTLFLFAVFAVPTLFVASVLPYRFWDSLAFGTWSRLIGERGHLWFPDELFDSQASRPLFYVGQGLFWLAFGHHEWLGRWVSALFALVFAVCVVLLAGTLARDETSRSLLRALTAAVALSSAVLAVFAAAGMSDVPLAAAVALTAVLLWSQRLGRVRLPLVALAAAAAVLAKPSAYLALLGLGLALLLDLRREAYRWRAVGGLAALAMGAVVGLVYDAIMAGKFDESLSGFIRSGNTTFFLQQGSRERWDAVLRAEWLGAEVRFVLLYGVGYAIARALGGGGRLAAMVAAPVAFVWSIAGPVIADGGTPYPFENGFSLGLVAWIGLAAALAAAPFVAQPEVLRRRDYAALVLWALPGIVAWVAYRPDQVRFLSPVWAPLALATAGALASLALGLARLRPAASAVPVAAVSLLVFANVPNVDGLGGSGWHGLLDLGWSDWGSRAATENYAYGPFSYEIDAARANLAPDDELISSDGRLAYFFPGQTDIRYARSCADLRGRRVFVLLTSGESAEIMTRSGSSADPLAWLQCASPRLFAVEGQPGIDATFVVGRPPAVPPDPSACRIDTHPGELSDAVFAGGIPYARAKAIRKAAAKVGFGPKIERTGCSSFRVVVTGVPDDAKKSFVKEAAGVGFRVAIVPAVRYPEVPPDAPPMR
jgi:4-amino-4-deoxy-L-arabinose transferase-like glycosyltransferase